MRPIKLTTTLSIAITLLGILANPAHAGEIDKAVNSYKAGNYKQALTQLQPLAHQGNATAQYYLGIMYANGQGVGNDHKVSAQWVKRAAKQGHAQAQYFLSVLYTAGLGVPKDQAKATVWYQKFKKNPRRKDSL